MTNDLWGVELKLESNFLLEARTAKVVEHLRRLYPSGKWLITEIDGTGRVGGELTERGNEVGEFWISSSELLLALNDDGQIFELGAILQEDNRSLCRIMIIRGSTVEVMGIGSVFPESVLGQYQALAYEPYL